MCGLENGERFLNSTEPRLHIAVAYMRNPSAGLPTVRHTPVGSRSGPDHGDPTEPRDRVQAGEILSTPSQLTASHMRG